MHGILLCISLGDLVSPGFYIPYKTAMDIVTEPHDSADGYLFDFAINLQCLTFLRGANILDVDEEKAALDFIISSEIYTRKE